MSTKDNELYLKVTIISIAIVMFYSLLAFLSSTTSAKQERNKDRLIQIETNSIGCIKYSYNGDVFWKCPVNSGISSIEENHCQLSGRTQVCKTDQIPAVN
jgi:hypothetical protein